MDYNHIISLHNETNFDELNSDLPFAIFMMKLLSFKLDFRKMSNKSYEEYIKSDNPIKFRYYIQTELKEEIKKCFKEAKEENINEKNELHKLFYSEEHPSLDSILYAHFKNKKPSYTITLNKKDKKKIYDKYLKDYIPDKETKHLSKEYLHYWVSTDNIKNKDQEIYEIIEKIINSKIDINHEYIERIIIAQFKKINTRKSIYELLESINDVNKVGLY